ncbi:glycosyltransferase family 2 protein [Maricaulis sp.]|uniref:glycosyltransferase family 2 protein n=1 Tax=Maricaulis sp. TaxID=1486257 RepID=UPI003A9169CC
MVATAAGRPVAMGVFLNYRRWLRENEPDETAIERDIARWAAAAAAPCVTVVMPCYNSRADHLRSAVSSVLAQTYPHWELILVADDSEDSSVSDMLAQQAGRDPRIQRVVTGKTCGISAATNAGARAGRGPVIAFLDHDDLLHRFALSWIVDAFEAHASAQLVFTDEDKLDASNRRCDPYFKPGFNRALLYSRNYVNHAVAVRRPAFERAGGLDPALDGAQDHDLLLRVLEHEGPEAFCHISRIAYHWRTSADRSSFSESQRERSWSAGRAALLRHFQRTGMPVRDVVPGYGAGFRIVFPERAAPGELSIIVPTRDRGELLRACLAEFVSRPDLGGVEIVVIDNGSSDPDTLVWLEQMTARHPEFRVVRDDGEFNYSRLVNRGVAASHGRTLLLLNNDVLDGNPGWLDELAGWARSPWVGCAGAALHYPDGRLQHGGIVLGPGGGAGHYERCAPAGQAGMFGHLRLARCVTAVTAACLAIRREVFDAVDGFDEVAFPTSFSDVDLGLRVGEAGYENVWTPYASLTHLEGASRGREGGTSAPVPYQQALQQLSARWGHLLDQDPFVNENLDPTTESVRLRRSSTR